MAYGRKRVASSPYPSPAYSPIKKRRGSGSLLLGGGRVAAAAGRMAAATAGRYASKLSPAVRAAVQAYKVGRAARNFFRSKPKVTKKMGSHYNSKAAGYFKAGKKITANADKFSVEGFVRKVEWGGVVTDSANQVTYVAQSTMPARQVAQAMCAALLKKLLVLANHRVKSEKEVLLDGQYYNSQVDILYKTQDGNAISTETFVITTTDTFETIALNIYLWMEGLGQSTSLPNQFLSMRYFVRLGTLATANLLQAELDLTTCRFDFYGKSQLKIQNRTINSTGNDTSEDVDNVPLKGKSYEFKTNGTIYRDYGEPGSATSAAITTSPTYGVLPTVIGATTGTKMYDELPDRTQFIGCKKIGTAALDPGEVKTSILLDKTSLTFGQAIQVLFARKTNSPGVSRFNQYWIGRTRLFGFEKLINAVAMSATNQFNLAVEHQFEIGAICKIKRSAFTAPSVTVNTGAVN